MVHSAEADCTVLFSVFVASQVLDYVDPESVSFALCRVPIGTGSFKREKFLLLNFNLGELRPRRTCDALGAQFHALRMPCGHHYCQL